MKRILFSMIALLAFGGTAFADELTVEDVILSKTADFTALLVHLNSDEKSSVESVVFQIKLPDEVEFVLDSNNDPVYEFGPDYTSTSSTMMAGIQDDGSYKFALASPYALRGKKGLLIALKVKPTTPNSLEDGQSLDQGELYNITFTSQSGKTNPEDSKFGITVTNRVVFDENSPFSPIASGRKTFNVLVKRTLKANTWSTICLPFDMSNDQLVKAFGNDVLAAEFDKCSYNETDDAISIEFVTTTGTISYGKPHLIKVSSPISTFTVDGVKTYSTVQSQMPEADLDNVTDGWGTIIGHYELSTMAKNDLFLQDNTYYYAVEGQTIKGFRAIFNFYEGDTPFLITKATSRGMLFVDGKPIDDATGISSKRYISENKRVYSVTGRFMGENVDMKSLPKGIYIVDGVKIIND